MGPRRVDFGSQKWVEKKEGQKVEEKWAKIVQGAISSRPGEIGPRVEGGLREGEWPPLAGPGLLALKIID